MLVINGSGHTTGSDTKSVKQEISRSSYWQDFLTDDDTGDRITGITHSVNLLQLAADTYQVQVTGLKLGTYALLIAPFSHDGSPQATSSIPGIAEPGSVSTFQIKYSPDMGAIPETARIVTFQGTLRDITDSLKLGLIDDVGIVNALSAKIHAAAEAVAEHESDDAKEVLKSFKNQVSAQTGKHITGVAPQVLQEDADSLISQLPKK